MKSGRLLHVLGPGTPLCFSIPTDGNPIANGEKIGRCMRTPRRSARPGGRVGCRICAFRICRPIEAYFLLVLTMSWSSA
jgi:hypothetical protein